MASSVAEVKSQGQDMDIFTFAPDGDGKRPAVIVIQEIFGVNDHMKDVANRFADAGFVAAAPDLFHREGKGTIVPFEDMATGMGMRGRLSDDDIKADVAATVAYLKSQPNVDGDNIGIVGYCFGGFVSYMAAAEVPGIAAAAIYYGGGIPVANIDAIEAALKAAGKDYESHTYAGAGHGFFCDERGSYNEAASKDAWAKSLAFFGQHLK